MWYNVTMTAIEEISEKAKPVFKKFGVKRARVFGSFARGEARPDSDIDLLVEYSKTLSLWDLVRLRDELAERLSRPVDVVSEGTVVPYFRDSIYRELQPLYEE
ncbi:MAG: Nucleotidyltransferase [Parcubacteria group bacterium GW2011_GWA2_56_21]|nr:MAG: Nucleotidyltransferase [Parcubacteria group bacterium GW2011_GWA2_56_21]